MNVRIKSDLFSIYMRRKEKKKRRNRIAAKKGRRQEVKGPITARVGV
jgi:hypothetical protein